MVHGLLQITRRRVDEDKFHQKIFRGYNSHDKSNKKALLFDFILFCKLAKFNSVVPEWWNWDFLIQGYGHMIEKPFTKNDAIKKYNKINFSREIDSIDKKVMLLRVIGNFIYARNVLGDLEKEKLEASIISSRSEQKKFEDEFLGMKWDNNELFIKKTVLFSNVGGISTWSSLMDWID